MNIQDITQIKKTHKQRNKKSFFDDLFIKIF